ncbi:MAG: hypothetical protein HXX08_12740 [Chloroflexi bacterium]|uniref:Uncharacterized protein n=1 Tax=Candidatus Chlorohelix allophototropha TaxID=3003348 RepID=A0A8T7M3S9_9CHLR|nr:hypothetical protein [Chloroflexota bacterium]WJW66109.1 hypothetical protein OZ401_001894 [Chloroflexota bacterium L227-S17]
MLVKNVSGNITRAANFRSRLLFPRGSAVQSFSLIAESKSRQDDDPPIGNQAQVQPLQLAGVVAGKKSSSRKSRKAV